MTLFSMSTSSITSTSALNKVVVPKYAVHKKSIDSEN